MELSVVLSMVMFAVFMLLILTGYNVAFSFVSTALAFSFIGDLTGTFDPNTLNVLPGRWQNALEDQTLLAVPLFVLMGAILERSGLAERLLNAIGMLMGPLRGGVAAAVVVVGTLLAAATGVVAATVIVMGLLSLPAMVKLGYDNKLSTGVIIASGTLAQMLPPSLVLILLAQQLGVGILGLFAGALIPGLILSGLYIIYALGISYLRPHLGPAMPKEQRTLHGKVSVLTAAKIALPMSLMIGLVMLMMSPQVALVTVPIIFVVLFALMAIRGMLATEVLVSIVPILVLIIGVLFSIFQGIATPSESGSVGVLGALMLACLNWYVDKLLAKEGAAHATLEWRLTPKALKEAGTSTLNIVVLVMTLLVSSTFFSQMFFQLGGSDQTSEWLTAVGGRQVRVRGRGDGRRVPPGHQPRIPRDHLHRSANLCSGHGGHGVLVGGEGLVCRTHGGEPEHGFHLSTGRFLTLLPTKRQTSRGQHGRHPQGGVPLHGPPGNRHRDLRGVPRYHRVLLHVL